MRIVVAAVFFACVAAPTPFSPAAARSEPACASQVIVMFSQPLARDPDEALVTSLANAAEIRLAFLRSAAPGLYVFAIAGDEPDPSCKDALERLRRDARVRSAELDARRKPQLTLLMREERSMRTSKLLLCLPRNGGGGAFDVGWLLIVLLGLPQRQLSIVGSPPPPSSLG